MAGWLGRTLGYYSTDRVQTNLLVARATGTSDTGANYYLTRDSNYLAGCGAILQDWSFSGGHSVPPDSVKSACLTWLVSQRVPSGLNDRVNALGEASGWRSRVAAGQRETVLRECVNALMTQPRSWRALHAQLVLDELMRGYDSFRSLAVENLAQGDFASDLFYYTARAAANNGEWPVYWSCLKALTGITGTCGDRAGDVRSLLEQHSYPGPLLKWSRAASGSRLIVESVKDSPGLDYVLKTRASVANGTWQDVPVIPLETNTTWSGTIDLPSEPTNQFYRIWTTPTLVTNSPPFPM
jgi:hypothetical protein